MNTEKEIIRDKVDEIAIHLKRAMDLLDGLNESMDTDSDSYSEVDKYMALPYTITVEKVPDKQLYTGCVKELNGLEEYGKTYDEAYDNTIRAMKYYIKSAIKQNKEIPIPKKKL